MDSLLPDYKHLSKNTVANNGFPLAWLQTPKNCKATLFAQYPSILPLLCKVSVKIIIIYNILYTVPTVKSENYDSCYQLLLGETGATINAFTNKIWESAFSKDT